LRLGKQVEFGKRQELRDGASRLVPRTGIDWTPCVDGSSA
jgi:hypothetical protein